MFGHRGASALLPENTMESFQQALADGANALEMDVHLTSDSHLVVAHDPDGLRMAGDARRISECTLEEVAGWNVAKGSPLADGRTMRMPVFSDVIRSFPEVPISVDLKPDDPRAAHVFLETVRAGGAESRVTVGSFHGDLVRLVRRLGYRGPTALTPSEVSLTRFLPCLLSRAVVRGQAAMIPVRSGSIRLDGGAFIQRCRKLGLRVDYWVVNDPSTARALISAGATGIVTDDPGRLAALSAEIG